MQGCREVLNSTLLSVAGRGALYLVMMRQPQHVFAMLEDSLVSARRRRVRAISDSVRVWWLSFLHRSGDPRVDFFVVLCVSRGSCRAQRAVFSHSDISCNGKSRLLRSLQDI